MIPLGNIALLAAEGDAHVGDVSFCFVFCYFFVVSLHAHFYLNALPAVDGGLEAGAVDNGLGYRQTVHLDVDGVVVMVWIGDGAVHLVGDVDDIVPLRAVGQDGIDGELVAVGIALLQVRTVAKDAEVHLQRLLIDDCRGEGFRDGAFAHLCRLHPYRWCQAGECTAYLTGVLQVGHVMDVNGDLVDAGRGVHGDDGGRYGAVDVLLVQHQRERLAGCSP